MNRSVFPRLLLAAFAVLAFAAAAPAQAQRQSAGGLEAEARACLDRLIREVPTYRALRDLRGRIDERGFRVVSKRQEPYDFKGQPVFIYAVQVTGEREAYRLACHS